MNILDQDIKFLPGVGPNRKKMLSDELGIETYGDLLEYYPYPSSSSLVQSPDYSSP